MKKIGLGTAMWGWSVKQVEVFKILDIFYEYGGRTVDCASNYPINGLSDDKGEAYRILLMWIRDRRIDDLKIIHKIGSINNKNSSKNDLSPKTISEQSRTIFDELGSNLHSIMIHWDNRKSLDTIVESLSPLKEITDICDIEIGLSGIADIETYYQALSYLNITKVIIEAKCNFIDDGTLPYMLPNSELSREIWGYGISVSGLKLKHCEYRNDSYAILARDKDYHTRLISNEKIKLINDLIEENEEVTNIYHAGMLFAELNPNLSGYFIAPSNINQLVDTLDFKSKIREPLLDILADKLE